MNDDVVIQGGGRMTRGEFEEMRADSLKFHPHDRHCCKCGFVLFTDYCYSCNYNLPAEQHLKAEVIIPADELGILGGDVLDWLGWQDGTKDQAIVALMRRYALWDVVKEKCQPISAEIEMMIEEAARRDKIVLDSLLKD